MSVMHKICSRKIGRSIPVPIRPRGGPSSYIELISCLDVMKDAAAIYKADPLFGDFAKNPKGTQSNQPANRSPK
jgi:hypothetical protein